MKYMFNIYLMIYNLLLKKNEQRLLNKNSKLGLNYNIIIFGSNTFLNSVEKMAKYY